MQQTTYQKINKVLSWKRIILFNIMVFFGAVAIVSSSFLQNNDIKTNSRAAEFPTPTPMIISNLEKPDYPSAPPHIDRVGYFFGKPGDTIVIYGNNFGDNQWDSRIFVGNADASDSVVRWTNSIIEAKIPYSARTGKVWVVVNKEPSTWDGNLLVISRINKTSIGFDKTSTDKWQLVIDSINDLKSGLIEFAYTGPVPLFTVANGVTIDKKAVSIDNLGNKLKIEFSFKGPIINNAVSLGIVHITNDNQLEITRAEIEDSHNNIIPLFADPLSIKIKSQ